MVLSYAQIWNCLPLAVLGIQIPKVVEPELFAVANPTNRKDPTGRVPAHPGIWVEPEPIPARNPIEEAGLAPETDKVFKAPPTPGVIGSRTIEDCCGGKEVVWWV